MLKIGENLTIDENNIVAIIDLATIFQQEDLDNTHSISICNGDTADIHEPNAKSLIIINKNKQTQLIYSHLSASTLRRRLSKRSIFN